VIRGVGKAEEICCITLLHRLDQASDQTRRRGQSKCATELQKWNS
jgi:hypothetical protein